MGLLESPFCYEENPSAKKKWNTFKGNGAYPPLEHLGHAIFGETVLKANLEVQDT